jgi:subtilase family serine protease
MQNAYGLTALFNAGYTGLGQTIVIVDSFGSPTIAQDLATFDAGFGLPDPPSFTVLAPLGTVPFDPNDTNQLSWAYETTQDVEWAHAMAPGASIVLLTSPVDETQGVQGLPEFLQLEQYALDHGLGRIISQSWGTAENTLFNPAGYQLLNNFEDFYQRAAQEGVTVLAGTGDSGSANVDVNNQVYPFPTVLFPASSPFVTAVGGTSLYADTDGNYQSETVWNDDFGASGGGISQWFSQPRYQYLLPASVRKTLNHHRGLPDVAYNADPNTSMLVYVSFFPTPAQNGWVLAPSGTSDGPPQWAGIVADLSQYLGHSVGFLNPKLYLLGAIHRQSYLFRDIQVGNNGFDGLPGYDATAGWDLASGWGSPDLSRVASEMFKLP